MADQNSYKSTKLAMFRQIVQTLLKYNFILCNGSIQMYMYIYVSYSMILWAVGKDMA